MGRRRALGAHRDGTVVAVAAEALLDKLLFTLAANSWHGVHGAVLPAACLARASRYRVPELVRSVTTGWEARSPWYGRQVYRGQYEFTRDLLNRFPVPHLDSHTVRGS